VNAVPVALTQPALPPGVRRRFALVHAVRQALGARWLRSTRATIEAELLALNAATPDAVATPCDEIDAADCAPERFWSTWGAAHRPVVVRGFARHWPAVQEWTPAWLRDRYGDETIPVRLDGTSTYDYGYTRKPLRDLVDSMLSGGTLAATGIEDIVHAHDELGAMLRIDEVNRLVAPKGKRGAGGQLIPGVFTTELFLANQRSRTSLHCAFGNNLFVMIEGRKRWTQIDPRWTALLGPRVQSSSHFMATDVDYNAPPAEQVDAGYPLFRYAPRTEAWLEPGDAIFSPQWWWHAVENDGPTIGLACRVLTDLFHGQPTMSLLALCSRAGLRMFIEARRDGHTSDRKVLAAAESWED